MTIIESTVSINKPVNEVFEFLSDLNNHQQLMPETIYNWSSTKDEVRFTIQNMAKLALKVSSITKDKEISVKPIEEAPFELELKWNLADDGEGNTQATHTISADLNMMMKMIVSAPLQKLVDHEAQALKTILST
ncbi:SRPBCC family protein [Daejeonella sp.]|jgi:carbon monoxide dehydrogenase subunit G|uniref:SRPBCC family protein n=1 Tax=Daejeonella sp. TaxID=2805397 RepID=UPI0027B958F2|nr:SRPBCC family protein [Daejeonella sp.]